MFRDLQDAYHQFRDLANAQDRINKDVARALRRSEANELEQARERQLAYLFDQGARYTSVVLVAAYAGFFAGWGGMRQALPVWSMVLSVTLVLASLLLFVLFEVVKMLSLSAYFRRINEVQGAAGSAGLISKLLDEHGRREIKLWHSVAPATIVTGFSGGLVLLIGGVVAFVRSLGQHNHSSAPHLPLAVSSPVRLFILVGVWLARTGPETYSPWDGPPLRSRGTT